MPIAVRECDAAHWEASTGLVSSQIRCLAIGAASGALLGSMHDVGINDRPSSVTWTPN
jgi:uncharacterized membrane protein